MLGLVRITAIEPILVDVPLRAPVHGVHGIASVQRSLLVRVATDAGGEGWGNVDPTPGYSPVSADDVHATVGRLAPALAGADALNVHAALARMDRAAGGLTVDEAPAFIRRLEPYGLTLVEQPIVRTDIAGLARIRAAIGIPLMADESVTDPGALVEIIRREAADLVKLKVMKQGGLLRTRETVACAA